VFPFFTTFRTVFQNPTSKKFTQPDAPIHKKFTLSSPLPTPPAKNKENSPFPTPSPHHPPKTKKIHPLPKIQTETAKTMKAVYSQALTIR
jgi:hypothetical protein